MSEAKAAILGHEVTLEVEATHGGQKETGGLHGVELPSHPRTTSLQNFKWERNKLYRV